MTVEAVTRTRRREPGGARVTPRDLLLLAAVADASPVTLAPLAGLLGMSREMARRRARALHALGLLEKAVLAMHLPDRLTLTLPGRELVAEKFGRDLSTLPAVRVTGADYRHHDLVVAFAVALRLACARHGTWRVAQVLFEREVRRTLGAPRGALVPDAVAILTGPEPFALCLEADTGSCDPKWVAERKLAVYGEHRAAGHAIFGCASFAVCVVAPSLRRIHALTGAMWRAGVPEGLVYLAPSAGLIADTILTRAWFTPRGIPGTEDVQLTTESPLATVVADRCRRRNGECAALSAFALDPGGDAYGRSAIARRP